MLKKTLKKTLKRIFLGLLGLILLVVAVLAYNYWLNQTFVTTFYDVTTDKPVGQLRIVELSDLHLREYGNKSADLVQRVHDLSPDLIVVAGDMNIDTNQNYSVVVTLMRQLVTIAPVYYAPGNHEWAAMYAHGVPNYGKTMAALGVHWLNPGYEDININGAKIRIGGFFEWPRDTLERSNSRQVANALNNASNNFTDTYTILICHCPEVLYTSLEDYEFDLVFSGHAHGGQIRLPGTNGLWSTSQGLFPKYTSGIPTLGHSRVVISRGLGDSEPIPRIFNEPELVVVDLTGAAVDERG